MDSCYSIEIPVVLYGFTRLHIFIWKEQLEKSAIFLHVLVEVEVVLLLLM